MSLQTAKPLHYGRLTYEDIGISASAANRAAFNQYNLTTGFKNEREKAFYQDHPRVTLEEMDKYSSENPVDLNNMTEKQRRDLSLANKMVSISSGGNEFTVLEGKEINDRDFWESIDFAQDGAGRQSIYEGLLKNDEIKQIVKSEGSTLKTKELDNLSRFTVMRMISDKKKDENYALLSTYGRGGIANNTMFVLSDFAGQALDPFALGIGLGIGGVARAAGKTLLTMAARSSKTALTIAGVQKSKKLAQGIARTLRVNKRKKAAMRSIRFKKIANKIERFHDTSAPTRFGRILKNSKVGATYGLAESIATEPLFYYMAQKRQDNYGIGNSILNIMFGAAFSGMVSGVHGALSRKPNSVRHLSNERQVDIMTTAHNQAMSEMKINIDPIANLDPKTHYMNAVERSNEAFTTKKSTDKNKKVNEKTLVEKEEPSEKLDYVRLESQISNLREIIQTLRASKSLKDSPKNNKKFEGKIKEVEKILNKGRLPEFDMLPPSVRREINKGSFVNKDPVARAEVENLMARNNEAPETTDSTVKEADSVEPLETPKDLDSGEPTKAYTIIKNETIKQEGNELDALDDTQFNALIERIKGCRT